MRLSTFSTACLVGLLACVLVSMPSARAAERPIKINNSGWATIDHPCTIWFSKMPCDLLNQVSGGRFDIRIHPSCTLVGMADSYQAVITGMTPFNIIQPSATPGVFPLMELFSLPGLFPNQATSNIVAWHLLRKYPQFERELDPGVVRVSTQIHMRADLHTRRPVRSLADLKGKRIGCQNHQVAEALAALGASVSVLDVVDMYTSLDKGIVDGVACAWGSVDAYRLYEVAKFHTLIGICPLASHFLANRSRVWDHLDENQQALMKALEPTFQDYIATGNTLSSMSVRFNHAVPGKGHELIVWSDEDMKTMRGQFRPFWDTWAADMEARGLPGKAMLEDAIQLVDAYTYG